MPEQLRCKCGNYLGTIHDGLLWIGGWVFRSVDGRCGRCNAEFHWCVSDKTLEKLLDFMAETRSKYTIIPGDKL